MNDKQIDRIVDESIKDWAKGAALAAGVTAGSLMGLHHSDMANQRDMERYIAQHPDDVESVEAYDGQRAYLDSMKQIHPEAFDKYGNPTEDYDEYKFNHMGEGKKRNNSIRLTESQLKKVIKETVNNILSELDWKTYANASKKRLDQYRNNPENKELWDKSYELNKMANQRFDDDYVGTMKYDTFGDKLKGKHSATFSSRFDSSKKDRMPYGAINGYNKSGDKIFSTEKGTYHSHNGITSPGKFFKDKEVADNFKKANDELWDYYNGDYEYKNGEGWKLKK